MRKFIVFVATALMSGIACAQIVSSSSSRVETIQEVKENKDYNRIIFGYAPTKFSIDGESETMHGFNAGWIAGVNVSKRSPFYLETGLMLNASFGECLSESDKLVSLEMPINATYRWKISSNKNYYFAPYFGFHFKVNTAWLDDDSDSYFEADDTNRFQFGMQLGGNLDLNSFTIGLGWNYDFIPIAEIYKENLTTSGLRVNIGFLF